MLFRHLPSGRTIEVHVQLAPNLLVGHVFDTFHPYFPRVCYTVAFTSSCVISVKLPRTGETRESHKWMVLCHRQWIQTLGFVFVVTGKGVLVALSYRNL